MVAHVPATEPPSSDSKLASILDSLTINTLPRACEADAILSEAEIFKAYHGSFSFTPPSPLCGHIRMLTVYQALVDDLQGLIEAVSLPRLLTSQLSMLFEHSFSAVMCFPTSIFVCPRLIDIVLLAVSESPRPDEGRKIFRPG